MEIKSKNHIAKNAVMALAFTMLLWLYGEVVFAIYVKKHGWQSISIPHKIFFPIWTLLGIYEAVRYLWLTVGHEKILFDGRVLEIKKGLFGIWISKKYLPRLVRGTRDHGKPYSNTGWRNKFSIRYGRFSFSYNDKEKNFGIGLNENQVAEVKSMLAAVSN